MKIKDSVNDLINKQINHELYSAYIYLSMSSHFEKNNLRGFAHWMRVQAKEEVNHAMKFFDFLYERGGQVSLTAIAAPRIDWNSVLEVFQEAYKHEQKVTSLINGIMDLAIVEKDHATISFLKWFIDEQVEEEVSADEVVQKLKMIGDSTVGLYSLDKELGQRED